jgi:hypothetical protein
MRDDAGSTLPLATGLLAALFTLCAAVGLVGELAATRLRANLAAHSLAVTAAGAALAGADGCARARASATVAVYSCMDNGTDVRVVVTLPVTLPLTDFVVGESRVGYGGAANGLPSRRLSQKRGFRPLPASAAGISLGSRLPEEKNDSPACGGH